MTDDAGAPVPNRHSIPGPPAAGRGVKLVFGAVLILAGILAWSGRSPNSDFFMALGGGDDVAAGRLGKPDTWSYITDGRVWINQSWLAGVGLYHLWKWGGERAAIVTRIALMVVLVIAMMLWLGRRGISWPAACLSIGIILLVCRYYFSLRPNLLSIAAVPVLLWMLERGRSGSIHWAWPIGLLLGLWAQCHGGYLFGWGIVGLWLVAHAVPALRQSGPWNRWRWGALCAALLAVAVTTPFVSPFGLGVYAQTLTMLPSSVGKAVHYIPILGSRLEGLAAPGGEEWRTIRDWWPLILDWNTPWAEWSDSFEETGPFVLYLFGLVGVGTTAVILMGRTWSRKAARAALQATVKPDAAEGPATGPDEAHGTDSRGAVLWSQVFYLILTIVAVVMAFAGRRFVPLAAVILALPLAGALDVVWSVAHDQREHRDRRVHGAAGYVGAGLVLLLAVLVYPMVVLGYSAQHPFIVPQSVFERQFMANGFPVAPARFMNIHDIRGPIFHSYGAETYLHWSVPGVLVGCGGRAQQIYTEDDLKRSRLMESTKYLQPQAMAARNQYFAKNHVAAIVLPAGTDWEIILGMMATSDWMPVLFDGDWCLLLEQGRYQNLWVVLQDPARHVINTPADDPAGIQARAQLAEGKISYPSDIVWLRTFALYLASPRLTGQAVAPEQKAALDSFIFKTRMAAIDEAQKAAPTALLYDLLDRLARRHSGPDADIRSYLESELTRLKGLPIQGPRCADILRGRAVVATLLARRYREGNDSLKAAQMQGEASQSLDDLTRLARWWQL